VRLDPDDQVAYWRTMLPIYIGVNGGGGWGRSNWAFTGLGTFTNHDISGGFAGGTIGYNWQMNPNWVFGLEADGDWANINGSAPCPNPAFNCTSNVRNLASFRGRVGYVAGPVLFYGTGGAAYANASYSALTFLGGAPPFAGGVTGTGLFSDDRWGYAAGAASNGLHAKLECQGRVHALRVWQRYRTGCYACCRHANFAPSQHRHGQGRRELSL
jgi:hypothetical protein